MPEPRRVVIHAPIFILSSGADIDTDAIRRALSEALRETTVPPGDAVSLSESIPDSACGRGLSFEDYCLDDSHDVQRLFGRGTLKRTTFDNTQRTLARLDAAGISRDVDWNAFNTFTQTHPKGRAGLENERRAYAHWSSYMGVPIPPFAQKRWDSKRAVARGRKEGRLRERERFFRNGPADVNRLLNSEPFIDEDQNALFRHAILFAATSGTRSGEPAFLRLKDVVQERRMIASWEEKKDLVREVSIPEPWFWAGPGRNVEHYLEHVRPQIAVGDEEAYFVSSKGTRYQNAQVWSNFMREGIGRTLGYTIGAHALRRFCATVRYAWGWTEPEVALFLGDTVEAVRAHYIDYAFVRRVGQRNLHRREGPPPPLPPLWNLTESFGLDK